MAKYVYDELAEAASQIRVLIILPGDRDDPVKSLLFTTVLTNKFVPTYEALSYAWGSQDDPVSVAVRTATTKDIEHLFGSRGALIASKSRRNLLKDWAVFSRSKSLEFGEVSITQNLGRALPYLRLRDQPRAFWIDAICVNQSNLEERAQQVQRMANLYRSATRVVFWIGEASHDSELVIDLVEKIAHNVKINYQNSDYTARYPGTPDAHWGDYKVLGPSALGRISPKAVFAFLARPWFCRLWVLQEVYFASHASILLCGTRDILWDEARKGISVLTAKLPGMFDLESIHTGALSTEISLCQSLGAIRTLSRTSHNEDGKAKKNFLDLVTLTSACQCLDKKDRVFALLSLVSSHQLSLKPNYALSAAQVFRATVMNLLGLDINPSLLQLCDLKHSEISLPSWIPNFAQPDDQVRLSFFHFCGSLTERPQVSDNVLSTLGKHIATIKEVHDGHCINRYAMRMTDKVQLLARWTSETGARNDIERMKRLLNALHGGDIAEHYYPPRLEFPPETNFWKYAEWYTEDDIRPRLDEDERIIYEHLLSTCCIYTQGRNIFVDENGVFGLSPSVSRTGDVVVQLIGLSTPIVLRPQKDGTHLVVGPAYHPPNMHMEPILGPLPKPFRAVLNEKLYSMYLDTKTGATQLDDPRLGALPKGWTRSSDHPWKEDFQLFKKGNIEECSWRYDPRTIPRELAKRGVELQEYRLA